MGQSASTETPAAKETSPSSKGGSKGGSSGLFSFGGSMAYAKQSSQKKADYDYLFKLLMVGDSGVGKSSVMLRFTDDVFTQMYLTTIGVDFKIKTLQIGETVVKLQVWDTSGQERFRTITSSYYRGAHGFLIVYDICNRESFENVKRWMQEIERYSNGQTCQIIVGNKTDLEATRRVSVEEGQALADMTGCLFTETSAKANEGVFEAYASLTRQIASNHGLEEGADTQVRLGGPKLIVADSDDDDEESFCEDEIAASMSKNLGKAAVKKEEKEEQQVLGGKKDKKKKNKKKSAYRAAQADVNVFRLGLNALSTPPELFTGDPIRCGGCGCMMNNLSSVVDADDEAAPEGKFNPLQLELAPAIHEKFEGNIAVGATSGEPDGSLWKCEFCEFVNMVDVVPEEVPSEPVVDYMVTPAPTAVAGSSDPNMIFCIDISGSMCVTTEVRGSQSFKGAEKRDKKMREVNRMFEGTGQAASGNVSHVSRLQCVQAAVEAQIRRVALEAPSTRVGLVTFNQEVTVIGDGTQAEVVVAGDRLDAFEELEAIGTAFQVEQCVSEAQEKILEKLWELEESGPTALGPALQLGIAVAGARPGSTVILCTDGLANVGAGSLEGVETAFVPFYTELAEQARAKGVTVSIISLIGTECRLENLGVVAGNSGGTVERVDACSLRDQLGALVDNTTIAVGTMAMICLHRGVHFKAEMEDEMERRNWLVRDLGTVHRDDEITISYGFRPKTEVDLTGITAIPFQAQLLYTRLDGTQILRVATAEVKVTGDRSEAEQHADAAVVATHAAQRAARKAQAGNYVEAQLEMRSAQRFLQRTGMEEDQLSNWTHEVAQMDDAIREEGERGGQPQSDAAAMHFSNFSYANSKQLL